MDSEKIISYLKNYKIALPVVFVLGILIGWLVIGWGIWPVQWYDAAPENLHPEFQDEYLRMAIYSSTMSGNYDIATDAWLALGDTAEETFDVVRTNPNYLTKDQLTFFEGIVGAEISEEGEKTEEVAEEEPEISKTEVVEIEEPREGPNFLLLGGLCLLLLIVAAAVLYFFVIRPQPSDDMRPRVLNDEESVDDEVGFEEDEMRFVLPVQENIIIPAKEELEDPVAQFMTTYMVGDDLYDDSFSIDAPTGEFLGECGVGISETIGVGEPKHVAALEIWLFDKNDIQTVTKVIMSEHAFDDDKIRMRLESKGEPVLAEQGKRVLLETETLQLEARIIDMEYGEGAAPDQSFFQRLTFELAVWKK
jgi:hypothetical protein